MTESREQPTFVAEAIGDAGPRNQAIEKLDGEQALETPVAAGGEPDLAHAAAPDQPVERVGADLSAGERRPMTSCEVRNGLRRSLQEAAGVQRVALGEQIAQRCNDQRL